MVAPKDRYFSSDGLKLHYLEWGDPRRPTLVLVHGNRDQSRSWDFFVSSLPSDETGFHVAALDLRGHGDSQWGPAERGYRHEDFLFDLAGLLHHLGKSSYTLIGHSLGGSMALLFAGCFPVFVKKLVLIESLGPYSRSAEDVPTLLAGWLGGDRSGEEATFYPTLDDAAKAIQKRFPLVTDAACAHMALHGAKPAGHGFVWKYDPRVRSPSYSTFSEEQIEAFIQRIECPVLLVYGKESGFMKSQRANRTGLFKNGTVVGISGAGHHVPHEKPEGLAEVVIPFLQE